MGSDPLSMSVGGSNPLPAMLGRQPHHSVITFIIRGAAARGLRSIKGDLLRANTITEGWILLRGWGRRFWRVAWAKWRGKKNRERTYPSTSPCDEILPWERTRAQREILTLTSSDTRNDIMINLSLTQWYFTPIVNPLFLPTPSGGRRKKMERKRVIRTMSKKG